MNIVVASGTGFIGRALTASFLDEAHAVTVLSRQPSAAPGMRPGLRLERWDAKTPGPWDKSIRDADAVVNLTGENIGGKRWTAKQKTAILSSRVESTRLIVDVIGESPKRPRVLINVSGVGYYGDVPSGDVPESFPPGDDFLATVCRQWEEEARRAEQSGVRVVTPRLGLVLEAHGGALPRMALPFRLFAGGPLGSGRQWFPWVHREDVIGVIKFLLQAGTVAGPVNVVGPGAVTMAEFSSKLGSALGRPSWAPVPAFVLKLILGEMAQMILTGQRAVPARLDAAGYTFRFPLLSSALEDIFRRRNGK